MPDFVTFRVTFTLNVVSRFVQKYNDSCFELFSNQNRTELSWLNLFGVDDRPSTTVSLNQHYYINKSISLNLTHYIINSIS